MSENGGFERDSFPDFCDTPERRAVWQRVEAFNASQPVSEKLATLAETLAQMAEIIDGEKLAPLDWARVQLEAFRERVRTSPPSTSRMEFKLLDGEAWSFIFGEPKLHAAYDVANNMETLEVIAPQLESLRNRGEQAPLRPMNANS